MIGVEINEFWPLMNCSTNWGFDLQMGNTLAQNVHSINPNLYVFIDIYGDWASDSAIDAGVGLITEPRVVFSPHIYNAELFNQNGTSPYIQVLHPTSPGKYADNDGWNYYSEYDAGNLTQGKIDLYTWLNLFDLWIQKLYNVPFVVTEGGACSPDQSPHLNQALKDMVSYYQTNNWGYAVSFFMGGGTIGTMDTLESDWVTPTPYGQTLITLLNSTGQS
jgi:hypothetical protein